MKIYQGHLSGSIPGFNFLEIFKLRKYDNINESLIMFGCYNKYDFEIVNNHKSILVIMWCGLDSKKINNINIEMFKKTNIINITLLQNVFKLLTSMGINCKLIKHFTNEKVNPIKLGNKIYTYLNKNRPKYYGKSIIDELKKEKKYEIIIGDLSISQQKWREGACEEYYSQAFIGLALSNFAGGGISIIEMGLRGIKVVTNVIELPNTIKWNTIDDIKKSIDNEKKNIGKTNIDLAKEVFNSMITNNDCFDLEKMIKNN